MLDSLYLRGNVESSCSNTVLWSCKSMQLYLHNSIHSLRLACFARKALDQMTVRGPVQPKQFCDSILRMWHKHTKSSASNILKHFSGGLWMPQFLLLSAVLNHHKNKSQAFSWGSGGDNSLLQSLLLIHAWPPRSVSLTLQQNTRATTRKASKNTLLYS